MLPSAKKPQQQQERKQRKDKKERTPLPVNWAMDHSRTQIDAEQSDDRDAKPVAQET
jgi:hypothetical protein